MATETQAPAVPTVTLTIDGRDVTVPRGTNLIEAARKLGIDIPYLCYHHQLTSFGGCRLCLVEVEKVPKLLAACNTLVADGMVVRTTGERIQAQRAGSLEFILLNHPLDCPVCDKGGECELQDQVFAHGSALSRLTEPKVHIEDYDLGPLMVRNQDRCIICKRCIKVMEEVVGEPVLEFGQRGVTTEVYTFEHEAFRAGFSGNTIRVCPVGALMSKPFRFTARPWELQKTPSVCGMCSVGCNLRLDTRENRLLRVVGLENPNVNDGWLCDRGQFGYDYIHSPDRLTAPLVRAEDGSLQEASWSAALSRIAERLRGIDGSAFGAIGSDRTTNEDCFALQRFVRDVVGSPNLDHRMGGTRSGYLSGRPEPGAIRRLPEADVVLVIGADVTADAPVLDLVLKRSLLPKKSRLIVATPRETALDGFASLSIRYRPGGEIAFVNALNRVLLDDGLVPPGLKGQAGGGLADVEKGIGGSLAQLADAAGVPADALQQAARQFAGARLGSLLYGTDAAEDREGAYFVAALGNLALLSGQAGKEGFVSLEVVRGPNTWGAREMGVLPDAGPGGRATPRGKTTAEMLQAAADGRLKALWISGADPVVDFPGGDLARRALDAVEFLVVTDLFVTDTARFADVVLPVPALAERNGTQTSLEGRVQRAVRGLDPRGGSRPEWEILCDLSELLEKPLRYGTAEEVLAEIRGVLGDLPRPLPPQLQRVETPSLPARDPAYPLRLFTGRLLFDRSTIQSRSSVLPGLAPDPFVELNPQDAEALGITEGLEVTVATPAGSRQLPARISDDLLPGAVFVPGGYREAPAGWLFADGQRTAPCKVTRLDEV